MFLCRCETFLHEGILDSEIKISCFSIIRCDCMARAGGGVCVYVSNSTTYDICLAYSNSVCELLIVRIHNPALIIILMYRPPSCPAEAFNDIISRSQALILSMPSPLPNIIMLGDFNFPDIDWTKPDLSCTYACCLPTPMALASGGSPMFPLVVHQPASPSIWLAVQSLRRGLSTNPGATMWCVCGCS